ncbi:MAG: hypothetical protein EON48_17880, partial [Acetobacteraceae bacterium]
MTKSFLALGLLAALAVPANAQEGSPAGKPKLLLYGNYCGPGNNAPAAPVDALDADASHRAQGLRPGPRDPREVHEQGLRDGRAALPRLARVDGPRGVELRAQRAPPLVHRRAQGPRSRRAQHAGLPRHGPAARRRLRRLRGLRAQLEVLVLRAQHAPH